MKNKNILPFIVLEGITVLSPILVMPFIAKTFTKDLYSSFLLLITIIYFLPSVVDFGVNFTSVRSLRKNKNDYGRQIEIISGVQTLKVIIGIIMGIAVYFYISTFLGVSEMRGFLFGGFPFLAGVILNPTWIHQGLSNAKKIIIFNIFAKICTMLAAITLVGGADDYLLLVLIYTWPAALISVAFFFEIIKKHPIKFDLPGARVAFFENLNSFLGGFAPNLYNIAPVFVFGAAMDASSFALFGISNRIVGVFIKLQEVIPRAYFPELIEGRLGISKIILLNVFLGFALISSIIVLPEPYLLKIIGPSYVGIKQFLLIIAVGGSVGVVGNSLSKGHFLAKGEDLLYRRINIYCSLISMFVTFLLMYRLGLIGIAYGVALGRTVITSTFLVVLFVRRKWN